MEWLDDAVLKIAGKILISIVIICLVVFFVDSYLITIFE